MLTGGSWSGYSILRLAACRLALMILTTLDALSSDDGDTGRGLLQFCGCLLNFSSLGTSFHLAGQNSAAACFFGCGPHHLLCRSCCRWSGRRFPDMSLNPCMRRKTSVADFPILSRLCEMDKPLV